MLHLSLHEIEAEARRRLDSWVYDFFAGGADDERTLRENEAAFQRVSLLPRILRGGGSPELGVNLLDSKLSMPVMISPTAFHRLAHPDGELATVRAAAAARTTMIVSMAATVAIEDIATEARRVNDHASLWFQLYIQTDREFTKAVIRRAEAAGCEALVVTVDSPVFGHRERDIRNGFTELPDGMCCENMRTCPVEGKLGTPRSIEFCPDLSWNDIAWLRETTTLPIVLKGVLHPADAELAVHHGVNAIIASNHGGRQLDAVPATLVALPELVDRVGAAIPVLFDGGIRRGTDVLKALALGAKAVGIGRPVLWGLAACGEDGVRYVLETFRTEIERAIKLCGCRSLCDVNRDLIRHQRWEESWWSQQTSGDVQR